MKNLQTEAQRPAGKGSAKLTAFLCWLVYTTAYFGRYSYASNITPIMDAFGISHADAGLVTTCFFFAYGIGQVVNGFLSKYYNRKVIIPLALCISVAINLAVFMGIPFAYFKYLWLLNGMLQSILWPTIVVTLSANLEQKDLSKAVVIMSSTVPVGLFVSYSLSSVFSAFGGFRLSFLCAAGTMSIAAVTWFALYNKALRAQARSAHSTPAQTQRKQMGRATAVIVVTMCILAVANNLIKDGLNSWIPAILKESFGLPEYLSIVLALVLPVFGVFGSMCNVLIRRKLQSFVVHAGVWYLLTLICIGIVMAFIGTKHWYVVLGVFGLISLFMHGTNSVITGIAPLYMREKTNSGLLAGVLNGCCYVGSTISSYGLGAIADNFGWGSVFSLLFCVCLGMVVLSAGIGLWERHNNS